MDMPSCDGVNTWFISKYARMQGLKAVLSGIGGDELFGGYPSFRRIAAAAAFQKMPAALLNSMGYSSKKSLRRMPYLSIEGIKGLFLFLRGHFTPIEIARQLGSTETEVWALLKDQPMLPSLITLAAKDKAGWMELNMYMQNQLLRDADVMSMAHGVEIRVPFLDSEVIAAALSIHPGIKYKGPYPKQILINAFSDQLPAPVWKRKKMGFSFPFTQWMNNSLFVKEMMENSSNANTRLNYRNFKEGKLHWSHLMSLILLEARGVA